VTFFTALLRKIGFKPYERSEDLKDFLEAAKNPRRFDLIDPNAAWDGDFTVYVSDVATRVGRIKGHTMETVYDSLSDKDPEVYRAANYAFAEAFAANATQRSDP
jgi:hypothetical protein